jgi:NADPH:quinone reductase
MSQTAFAVIAPHTSIVTSLPIPTPGKGEVLIKNLAISQNPADWKQFDNHFWIPELPFVLGTDTAGVVVSIGEGVEELREGDKVRTFHTRMDLLD